VGCGCDELSEQTQLLAYWRNAFLDVTQEMSCRNISGNVGTTKRQRNQMVDRCSEIRIAFGITIDWLIAEMTAPTIALKDLSINVFRVNHWST